MGERKVLNKYFPPDFDPALIPKRKNFYDGQIKVRVMLPMTLQCLTCGEYIYRGKKFNARKETVEGEDYLGIRIYRFYIKCTCCCAELVFKTDPKGADYTVEAGAQRNFEPWKQSDSIKALLLHEKGESEQGDAMKTMENRMEASKHEMDVLDALEEIKESNARTFNLTTEELLKKRNAKAEATAEQQLAQDEQAVKDALKQGFVNRLADSASGGASSDTAASEATKERRRQAKAAKQGGANAKPKVSLFAQLQTEQEQEKEQEGSGVGIVAVVKKKKKKDKKKKKKVKKTKDRKSDLA